MWETIGQVSRLGRGVVVRAGVDKVMTEEEVANFKV